LIETTQSQANALINKNLWPEGLVVRHFKRKDEKKTKNSNEKNFRPRQGDKWATNSDKHHNYGRKKNWEQLVNTPAQTANVKAAVTTESHATSYPQTAAITPAGATTPAVAPAHLPQSWFHAPLFSPSPQQLPWFNHPHLFQQQPAWRW
jgi:hypothetical protein